MPTYEYECAKCGSFEHFQSIKAPPLKQCPTCRGRVRRLIGRGAGVLFKGSGFYETDYRSESYKKSAQAEKSSHTHKADTGDAGKKKSADAGKAKAS